MTSRLSGWPAWLREVDAAVAVHSQIFLWGGVRDVSFLPHEDHHPVQPELALWRVLESSHYEALVVYHPIGGMWVPTGSAEVASEALGRTLSAAATAITAQDLVSCVHSLALSGRRVALMVTDAARLTVDPTSLTDDERSFWAGVTWSGRSATYAYRQESHRPTVFPVVVWCLATERDVPAWAVQNNEWARSVPVPPPDHGDRLHAARRLLPDVFAERWHELTSTDREALCDSLAGLCEGMTITSMIGVTQLAVDLEVSPNDIGDAVRAYRVGVVESPWQRDYLRRRVAEGETSIGRRVRGQPQAITKTMDLLKRSVVGMTGAQSRGHATRPRGILFFAGPTGVGKTELAKAITELVFGDERAYLRFDMSEFSSEQSEARLIGSPPGYIGHDAGGQLTDAVRRRPFSLVLFDEIEKAHPRILDKFLQVLEDGRLTDGLGTTVTFSETILVFTSNLGIYRETTDGTREPLVTPEMEYDDVERTVRREIADYFTRRLNRPELLNRLGDNIVVFGFISPGTGRELAMTYVDNVRDRLRREHEATLSLVDEVTEELVAMATADLSLGGRGVGAVLETRFVNPLARWMFGAGDLHRRVVTVTGLRHSGGVTTLEVEG